MEIARILLRTLLTPAYTQFRYRNQHGLIRLNLVENDSACATHLFSSSGRHGLATRLLPARLLPTLMGARRAH
jgi:hypothetical protein